MGYNTNFYGTLIFNCEPTPGICADLQQSIDHLGLQLQLTLDKAGVEWDCSEKTYDLDEQIKKLIANMRIKHPHFGLVGSLEASGEDSVDYWLLHVEADGSVWTEGAAMAPFRVHCPHCDCTLDPATARSVNGPK